MYRLYNPYSSDHHYTTSAKERDQMVRNGWRAEGVGWYSADKDGGVPLYRLFNPYVAIGTHHYTTDSRERDQMVRDGWRDEGVAWYGVKQK